jgi:hypothetical protein
MERRLIDANALLDAMRDEEFQTFVPLDEIDSVIDKAHTIDAEPVVHSSWDYRAYRSDARITVSGDAVCRKCHASFFRVIGYWFKYCPNCGAKMDAKEG